MRASRAWGASRPPRWTSCSASRSFGASPASSPSRTRNGRGTRRASPRCSSRSVARRGDLVARGARLLALQAVVLAEKLLARLGMVGIERDAIHGTHFPALRLVEVPDAFGAAAPVDHVDLRAHRDRRVGALGLADVTIDALIGDL